MNPSIRPCGGLTASALGGAFPAPSLEKLHCALVLLGCGPCGKCPEVPSPTGLGILPLGVKPVLARSKFADHRSGTTSGIVPQNPARSFRSSRKTPQVPPHVPLSQQELPTALTLHERGY